MEQFDAQQTQHIGQFSFISARKICRFWFAIGKTDFYLYIECNGKVDVVYIVFSRSCAFVIVSVGIIVYLLEMTHPETSAMNGSFKAIDTRRNFFERTTTSERE